MFQNDFLYDEIGNEPFTEVILVVPKCRLRCFNDIWISDLLVSSNQMVFYEKEPWLGEVYRGWNGTTTI